MKKTDKGYKEFRKYQTEFNRNRYKQFNVRINKQKNKKMIEFLNDNFSNKYVLELIDKDMKERGVI